MDKQRANLNAIADIVNELKKEYENIYCEPTPVCCCCPQQQDASFEPPSLMVCYKVPKAKGTGAAGKIKRTFRTRPIDLADSIPVKQSKSRELRGSVMYVGCDCEKRNGLQDDCQRTECHGSPECLTKPNPTCGPSRFSNDHRQNKSKARPQGPKQPQVKPPPTSLCPNFEPAPTKPCPGSIKGSTQPCPARHRNSSARGSRTYIAPVDISRGANAFFQYEPAKPKVCCQCPPTNQMQSTADLPCCPCSPSVQQQGFNRAMQNGNDLCCACPPPLEQAGFNGKQDFTTSRCCECSPQEYRQNSLVSIHVDGENNNNSTEQFGNNVRTSQRQTNKNLKSFIPQRQTNSNGPTTYDQCCQCPSFVQMQQYQNIPGNMDQCCPCPRNPERQFSNNFVVEQQESRTNLSAGINSQCCPCSQNIGQQYDNDPNSACCACRPPFDEQRYGNLPNQVEQECCQCPSTRNKEVYINMPDEEDYIQICVPPSQLSEYQSQAQQTNIPKTADQSCCVCSQEMIPESANGKTNSKYLPCGNTQVPCKPCVVFNDTYDQPTIEADTVDYPTVYRGSSQTANNTAFDQPPNNNRKCSVFEQNSWTYVMAPAYCMTQCASGCPSTLCCKVCKRSLPTCYFPCPPPCHH